MDTANNAEKFLYDFVNGYFCGKYTLDERDFFVTNAFVNDSTKTTGALDGESKTSVEVIECNKKTLAQSVYEFSLSVAITKIFSLQESCTVAAHVTAVVVFRSNSFKISLFHASIPSELLDYLNFLPVTEDFHQLASIKSEFERRTALLKRKKDSSIDPLTGILHGGAAKKLIETYLHNPHKLSVFMLFDLDNFKSINDTYGQDVGDDILKKISLILQESFRSKDIIARLGGDEFVVFMKDTSMDIVQSRADYVRKRVRTIAIDETCPLSVSVGIVFPEKTGVDEFEQLYFQADKALCSFRDDGAKTFYA